MTLRSFITSVSYVFNREVFTWVHRCSIKIIRNKWQIDNVTMSINNRDCLPIHRRPLLRLRSLTYRWINERCHGNAFGRHVSSQTFAYFDSWPDRISWVCDRPSSDCIFARYFPLYILSHPLDNSFDRQ